jgi:hypothetical protein
MNIELSRSANVGGVSFSKSETLTSGGVARYQEEIAVAKTGTLTTRTDANTGTLTMTSGHGILTGDIIDIYWQNADGTWGVQHTVTVGTVATNSVPIDGGAGDNLPVATTAIRAMVRDIDDSMTVNGDDAQAIGIKCDGAPCVVVLIDGADAVIETYVLAVPGQSFIWDVQDGSDNPLVGVVVSEVRRTHGDSSRARSPICAIG